MSRRAHAPRRSPIPLLLAAALAAAPGCDESPAGRPGESGTDGGAPGTEAGGPPVDGGAVPGSDGATPSPDQRSQPPSGCTILPADNPWNTDISSHAVHANSDAIVNRIGAGSPLHPDFGEGKNGIPYVIVDASDPLVAVKFDETDESDPGPYRIPLDAPIENGSDRHAIGVDLEACILYELYSATPQPDNDRWLASSGAIFNLKSNELRPIGWTSADAAGLPIYPGLVRHEEVAAGAINHALRFTVEQTRKAFVLPATHYASSATDKNLPAMGLRFRLKQGVEISGYSKSNQVILTALKRYGMILADNGGDWFVSGAPHASWDDDDLHQLKQLSGGDFEVVDTGPIRTSYQ